MGQREKMKRVKVRRNTFSLSFKQTAPTIQHSISSYWKEKKENDRKRGKRDKNSGPIDAISSTQVLANLLSEMMGTVEDGYNVVTEDKRQGL